MRVKLPALEAGMWVLTRIDLLLVTFRGKLEDPIAVWGQILAFLPLLRERGRQGSGSRILVLPKPQLREARTETLPTDRFARLVDDLGQSQAQARREVRRRVLRFLAGRGEEHRFQRLLRL